MTTRSVLDDVHTLDVRVAALQGKVAERRASLPETDREDDSFSDSFREWLGGYWQWRPPSLSWTPSARSEYEVWLKDVESWEQGYSLLASGAMPVRRNPPSRSASTRTSGGFDSIDSGSGSSGSKPSWFFLASLAVLMLAAFFVGRSRS